MFESTESATKQSVYLSKLEFTQYNLTQKLQKTIQRLGYYFDVNIIARANRLLINCDSP